MTKGRCSWRNTRTYLMNEILSANEMDSLSFIVAEENHVHNQRNDKAKFSSAGRFKDWLMFYKNI